MQHLTTRITTSWHIKIEIGQLMKNEVKRNNRVSTFVQRRDSERGNLSGLIKEYGSNKKLDDYLKISIYVILALEQI